MIKPVILAPFSPPALACIRSWGQQGWQPGFICIRSDMEHSPDSRYLTDWVSLPRHQLFGHEGIKIIINFLEKFNASGITCIEEKISCWINEHRAEFPEQTALWIPDTSMLLNISSKKRQAEVAASVGFEVLPTYFFNTEQAISVKAEHFPLCMRPSEPESVRPGFKARLVRSSDELGYFLKSFEYIRHPIMGQPFVNCPNLVIHGVRNKAGVTLAIEGFLAARKFEGFALTISPTDISSDLRQKCIAFTDVFDIVGNYHFDLLFDPQSKAIYFLEINTRFGGTTAKVLPCGYDEPVMAVKAYGIEAESRRKIRPTTVASRLALLKYLDHTLRKTRNPLDYPDENRLQQFFKTLLGLITYKDDVFDVSDLKGSVALYRENIMAKLR